MAGQDPRVRRLLEHGLTVETLKAAEVVARSGGTELPTLVHAQTLTAAREFLARIKGDVDALRQMCDAVDLIAKQTAAAAEAVQESERGTVSYLQQAEGLIAQKAAVQARMETLAALQKAYAMDEASLTVFAAGPAHPHFFDTFAAVRDRVQAAQSGAPADASGSTGTPSSSPHSQDLALAVEQLGREAGQRLSAALDSVLQYCLTQLRQESSYDGLLAAVASGVSVASLPASTPVGALVKGLQLLMDMAPDLGATCQTAYVHARRSSLLRALLDVANPEAAAAGAVTGERFVSDSLAWLRTRLLEEQELLEALFGRPTATSRGGAGAGAGLTTPASAPAPALPSLASLLTSISDGLARPLGARLEWAVSTQDEPVALIRVMDVLQFYAGSVGALIKPTASLCGAIHASHAQCRARLDTLAAILAARIKAAVPSYAAGLGPTSTLMDTAMLLAELCRTVSAGGMAKEGDAGGAGAEAQRQGAVRTCLDTLVQAAMDSTTAAAAALPEEDGITMSLNAAASLQASLSPYALASPVVQRLASEVAGYEESLVGAVSSRMLTESGMMRVLSAVRSGAGVGQAGSGQLSAQEVAAAATRLVSDVSSPAALRFDTVTDPRVRQRCRRDTAGVLSAAYATVFSLAGSRGGSAASGVKLPRTPADMDVLLDLQ